MNYIENPVLKRDLKLKLRIRNLIPAVVLRYICIAILFLIVLLVRLGTGILAFLIAETVMIMLFTPGSIYDAFVSQAGRRDACDLAFSRMSKVKIIVGKLIASNLYNLIVVIISNIIIFVLLASQRKFNTQGVLYATLVLLTFMFVSSVLSILFCTIFQRNAIASAFFVYFVIILLLSSVIIASPFLERTENQKAKNLITKSAIYVNPIVTLSRSLGKIDIMRTDYLYNVADPIVGRGFTYPDWRISCTVYLIISCLLLGLAIFVSFIKKNVILSICD
jgi:hypothetical protein